MTISKEQLIARKEQIKKDFDVLVTQIEEQENKIKSMKNNLNALAGAAQQCDLFIKQIEDKGEPMPPEKAQALDIATSQERTLMDKLTQEELNALSPRARKAHEDKGDNVISEILTENPNVIKEDKPAKKKKEKKDEEL